jgi:ADP-ribose pyrophosphatase YjhB (NUDIX family)
MEQMEQDPSVEKNKELDIRTLDQLKAYVAELPNIPENYKVAVGSLIFDKENKVILLERGAKSRDSEGKFEGVGGGVDEGETDLYKALQREIQEEVGDIRIAIDQTLTVMTLPGEKEKFWVVPIYLGRLLEGEPTNMEPEKIAQIHHFDLAEIPYDKLSNYQKVTMDAYLQKYGSKPYYQ